MKAMRPMPAKGTTLDPYDYSRSAAKVTGFARSRTGSKLIKLRHLNTGRETVATLAHCSRTFYLWA